MKKYEIILKHKVDSLKKSLPSLISEEFLKDRVNQPLLVITAVLLLTVIIFSIYRFKVTDFLVPTTYNSFMGVTELGSWYHLYRPLLVFVFCIILNSLLADLIYRKDKMVSYILVATNLFVAIITLAVVINFGRLVTGL